MDDLDVESDGEAETMKRLQLESGRWACPSLLAPPEGTIGCDEWEYEGSWIR